MALLNNKESLFWPRLMKQGKEIHHDGQQNVKKSSKHVNRVTKHVAQHIAILLEYLNRKNTDK
jgi:hypothetical protein